MKVVIQRVTNASVKVDSKIVGEIDNGLLLLVGITHDDNSDDVDYLVKKIINMRIFEDDNGKMNISLLQNKYDLLSISQFTLFAQTERGNRPGFSEAARPEHAKKVYEEFNEKIRKENIRVETGVFGSMMKISLVNDGPVTIIIDSKRR